MILMTAQDEHIEDGDLMRLLDTECSAEEDRMLRVHLAVCRECKRRHDRISRLTNRFATLLFQLEEPVLGDTTPAPKGHRARFKPIFKSWWSHRAIRVAAVVALVPATAAAVTPARAWVIDVLRSVLGADTRSLPVEQAAGSLVSFVPVGTTFQVEFLSTQSAGVLKVIVDTTDAASARLIGRAAGEGFLVLSTGLTIRNTSGSEVSYELRLPRTCEVLEVRLAGDVVGRYQVGSPLSARASWEVDLTGR